MTLYKSKFRIESTRFKIWDYRRTGAYFITICTKNKQRVFGDIVDDTPELNQIGNIVDKEWRRQFNRRNYIELDEFIIMPNHFHGIILLHNEILEKRIMNNKATETCSLNRNDYLKAKSISSIILQFKSNSTKSIRNQYLKDFCWQTRFYDHIIRTEKGLNRIREYIHNNPLKWNLDKYY